MKQSATASLCLTTGAGGSPACYEARAELQGLSMALRACLYQCREQEAAADQQDAGILEQVSSVAAAMDVYPGKHPRCMLPSSCECLT